MTGVYTLAAAAVVSAGTGIYEAVQGNKYASSAEGRAETTFGEQQGYAQMLYNLINDPSSVTKTPGYAFGLSQGEQAVQRQNAASGFFGSGNEAIALTQYGQQYGMSALTQEENLYASLSGLQTATSPNSYAQTGLAGQNQAFNQFGQVLQSLGYGASRGNYGSAGTSAPSINPDYSALTAANYDTYGTPWTTSLDAVG